MSNAQAPKKGLGRGFGALISEDFDKSILLTPADRIEKIPVGKIVASPYQPRRHFDDTALGELATSIKQFGIVQPLVVTPGADGYTLIASDVRQRSGYSRQHQG